MHIALKIALPLALALAAPSARAIEEDEDPKECECSLATVSMVNAYRQFTRVTGVIHKVTNKHIDFGSFVVPRNRIDLADLIVAESGDLVAFNVVGTNDAEASVDLVAGVLMDVSDGVVHLDRRSVNAADIVGEIIIIPPGSGAVVTYRRPGAHGENTIEGVYEDDVPGHVTIDGRTLEGVEILDVHEERDHP